MIHDCRNTEFINRGEKDQVIVVGSIPKIVKSGHYNVSRKIIIRT